MTQMIYNPVVVYRITDFCNLNCVFCAHARDLVRQRREANLSDVHKFGSVLASYQEATGHKALVSWLGGEPLLWAPLHNVSKLYRRWGIALSATTNGTLLASLGIRTHIVKNYAQLTISVDGFAPFHDKSRGMPGLFSLVEKAITSLAMERDRAGSPLYIRMNTVLMNQNLSQFPELCKAFASWGVNEITYNQLGGRDRPENFEQLRLCEEHVDVLEGMLPLLKADMKAKGVFINTNPDYLARFRSYAKGDAVPVDDCSPGQGFLFVDEHSRIAPCNFVVDEYGVPVREITTAEQFAELPSLFAEKQRSNPLPACRNCMSTRVSGKFTSVAKQGS